MGFDLQFRKAKFPWRVAFTLHFLSLRCGRLCMNRNTSSTADVSKNQIPVGFSLPVTWFVLSNRTQTNVYVEGEDRKLHFVSQFLNLEGSLKEKAFDSDRPGSSVSSAGRGSIHHGLDRTFDHKEESAIKFGKRIAENLQRSLNEQLFDELILVAEPHFLGILKEHLGPTVLRKVKAEVKKELPSDMSTDEIRRVVLKSIRNS